MSKVYLNRTCAGPEGSFLGETEYDVPGQMPLSLAQTLVDGGAARWVGEGPVVVVEPVVERSEVVEMAVAAPAPEAAVVTRKGKRGR